MRRGLRWRKLYANLLGIVLYVILFFIAEELLLISPFMKYGDVNIARVVIFWILAIVLIFVVVAITNKFNLFMCLKTHANEQEIYEFCAGLREHEIPDSLKSMEGRQQILKYLLLSRATSVKRAALMVRKHRLDKKIGLATYFSMIAISDAFNRAMANWTQEMLSGFADEIGGAFGGTNAVSGAVDNTWERQKMKDEAVWRQTQANNARIANGNTYDTQRKQNIADAAKWKANH